MFVEIGAVSMKANVVRVLGESLQRLFSDEDVVWLSCLLRQMLNGRMPRK
jgi:hypothetical protein